MREMYNDQLLESNQAYQREMQRQAEHERLVKLVRPNEPKSGLQRSVMAWTGRRLMASGQYLLSAADAEIGYDRPAMNVERA